MRQIIESRNIPILFRFLITVVLVIVPYLFSYLSVLVFLSQEHLLLQSYLLPLLVWLFRNLNNIISGVFLNIERPFKPGDWITFDGQLGKIKSISWRSTRLTSIENQEIFVPNDKLAQSTVMNLLIMTLFL